MNKLGQRLIPLPLVLPYVVILLKGDRFWILQPSGGSAFAGRTSGPAPRLGWMSVYGRPFWGSGRVRPADRRNSGRWPGASGPRCREGCRMRCACGAGGSSQDEFVEIALESRPLPVEGIVVEARADEPRIAALRGTGFYERMEEGRGEYLTPGQVAASKAKWPQQLFWGMRTVRVQQRSHERPGVWDDVLVLPNRTGRGYCRPSVYVDGRWIRPEMMGEGESLADVVYKDEILAVEVYQWPFGVPRLYTGKQACGVVLFWTEFADGSAR